MQDADTSSFPAEMYVAHKAHYRSVSRPSTGTNQVPQVLSTEEKIGSWLAMIYRVQHQIAPQSKMMTLHLTTSISGLPPYTSNRVWQILLQSVSLCI